jgi:hypothetical protein
MLDQIDAAWSLWDRIQKLRKKPRESIAERFYRVFESHGVHRNQIPRFFGHGLKVEDVQSNASLLPKLNESLLEALCKRFSIRREWLDGADQQPHHTHSFKNFVTNLRELNPIGELRGLVIAPSDENGATSALLILEESIGWVAHKTIYRYHLCDEWPFSYWKARAYLTACIAIAWKNAVHVRGRKAKSKEIAPFIGGKTLMGWGEIGIEGLGHKHWDPEDMALWPEKFQLGLDPERDNFGIQAGLRLWLELQKDGCMDTGLSMYEPNEVRKLFENNLKSFQEIF